MDNIIFKETIFDRLFDMWERRQAARRLAAAQAACDEAEMHAAAWHMRLEHRARDLAAVEREQGVAPVAELRVTRVA